MDILVTIPRSEWDNDDKEIEAVKNNKDLMMFWDMNRVPKKLNIGDRVYFVKRNKIDHSMKVIDIKNDYEEICTTTKRRYTGKCIIYLDDLQYVETEIPAKGFQGFRYINNPI